MKKILWSIFLSMALIVVEAKEVYYSDYSSFSPFQTQKVIKTDTVDVKEEDWFLWYKTNEVLKEYKLYNSVDNFSDDCYFSDYSDWSNNKIDNIGYIYETRSKYEYLKAKSARYIHLYNLQGSYGAFRITELDIKINNKSINYNYTCEGCWDDFDNYIHNGIYQENESYIDNGGSLIIDLKKEYPIHQIEIVFYIFDMGTSEKLYTLGFSNDTEYLYAAQSFQLNFSDSSWSNALKVSKNIYDLSIDRNEWTDNIISFTPIDNDYIIDTNIKKEYRYKEKWCRTKKIEKIYSDYSKEMPEGFTNKEEDSAKTYYSYRIRDKLELEISEINDKKFDLNNFILFNTDTVEIKDNIDWNKNGIYDIEFKLNNLIIRKKVNLNIDSNTIEDLKNKLDNLKKEYEEKIKKLEQQLNKCNLEKKCLNDEINQLNKLIEKYKKIIDNLNDKILDYENETKKLEKLNELYLNKIKELEEDIKLSNKNISNIIVVKNELLNKINMLEKENNELLSKIKSNNIELPKYILKICSLDKRIILIILLFLLCIFYLIRKKSNKK